MNKRHDLNKSGKAKDLNKSGKGKMGDAIEMGVLDMSSKSKAKDRSVKYVDAQAVAVEDYQTPRGPAANKRIGFGVEEDSDDQSLSMLGKILFGLRFVGGLLSFMALMG